MSDYLAFYTWLLDVQTQKKQLNTRIWKDLGTGLGRSCEKSTKSRNSGNVKVLRITRFFQGLYYFIRYHIKITKNRKVYQISCVMIYYRISGTTICCTTSSDHIRYCICSFGLEISSFLIIKFCYYAYHLSQVRVMPRKFLIHIKICLKLASL